MPVVAYVTPGHVTMLAMHDLRGGEDALKQFFAEVRVDPVWSNCSRLSLLRYSALASNEVPLHRSASCMRA